MIDSLDVMLWGKKVGTLVSAPKGYSRQICFYFDSEYAKTGYDIAPLRSPLSSVSVQKGLPIYPEEGRLFGGLPSFISDSLPDHWGNVVFSEWAKAHNIRAKNLSQLDRLAYIGRRGIGALEFVPPSSAEMESPFKVEISELSRLAQLALDEAKNFRAVMSPDFIVESLFKVGTSAGGRRPKAVINVNLNTGECYSGQVSTPLPDFVPMIIKFDEHIDFPSTRIEYSYYLMAREAGLVMMPSKIIEGKDETHFLTQRFDRKSDEKIHVQTLAAMSPLSSTYEDLFDASVKIGIAPGELSQLFLQMVMNVVGGNVDDHNKNFSFMMSTDGIWHISPTYDFTFSVDTDAPFYQNGHSMGICGKNRNIARADLLAIADNYGIKGAPGLIDKAVAVAQDYRRYALEARVPEKWIERIEREIRSRIERL